MVRPQSTINTHPGVLGSGTGDKFYPSDDEEGVLASREKLRESRLYGNRASELDRGAVKEDKDSRQEKSMDKSVSKDTIKRNRDKGRSGKNNGKGNEKKKKK